MLSFLSLLRVSMTFCVAVFALILTASPLLAQEPIEGPLPVTAAQKPMTNDTVIRMTKAGLDDSLIVQSVRTRAGQYSTTPDDLIALKEAGVSQPAISAMMAAGTGFSTHAAPSPVNLSPVSANVDDIGVYYKAGEADWQEMPPERVNFRQGGALKSIFSNNIIKKDMNGHVNGAFARLQLKPGDQVLLFTPEGTKAEEYIFLHFRQHTDDREFRSVTGNVFHSQTGADRDAVAFTATKVATHQYEFTLPADLKPGEYGVLPPGGANQRGLASVGKVFTFSVRVPR